MAQKAMILLADDEAVNREALRSILSDEFEILEATDGREAIRLLTEHEKEIEAVVLDLLKPLTEQEKSGFALLYLAMGAAAVLLVALSVRVLRRRQGK